MTDLKLPVPERLRRGDGKRRERRHVERGRDLWLYMARALGLDDLGGQRVLDMGCGTKFTQAILEYDLPIGEYAGVDVYADMIDFLKESVQDPRFSFAHMNTHNAMYNTDGDLLSAETRLPLPEAHFDLVCLFSVFTHIEPHDYHNMLKVLRRYVRPEGRVLFSLYLDERTGNGHGLIEQVTADIPDWQPTGKDFYDGIPDKPLQWAVYSRRHALDLIEGTGWEVEEVCLPNDLVQHHIICRPV